MAVCIGHNDGGIIDKFGGPLKAEYQFIKYYALNQTFFCLTHLDMNHKSNVITHQFGTKEQ